MKIIIVFLFYLIMGIFAVETRAYRGTGTDNAFDKRAANEIFRWKQIDFEGLSSEDAQNFIQYNTVPQGVEHYKGRVFITTPRRNNGIPSTLNYIDLNQQPNRCSPKLRPWPNITTNRLHSPIRADSNRIISVYRTRIDECERMWFVDTGVIQIPNNATQIQPPSIWIVNVNTGERMLRFEFPENVQTKGDGISSITVDVVNPNDCSNAYAYIPDLVNNMMYVYSLQQNKMWRFRHNYFFKDPLQGDFNIGGQRYQWGDGIFSITLGPRDAKGFRYVYFHPLVSTGEFYVYSEVLQNEQNSKRAYHGDDFAYLGNRGPLTQSSMHHFDLNSGNMFYAEISNNGIGCVNSALPYGSLNHAIVAQDAETMIYPSDLKVDNEDSLWMMTNRMPVFIYSQLNVNDYNFRVWKFNIADLVRGTVCQI